MEQVSLVLQGGFLTTRLPGKPKREVFISTSLCFRAEPVLSRIQENRKRVILPSIDNIKQDTFEVQRYENSAHGYSWELWCMYISPPKDWWDAGDPSLPIRSVPSACAPEAFASPDPRRGREGERLRETAWGWSCGGENSCLRIWNVFPLKFSCSERMLHFVSFSLKIFCLSLSNSSPEGWQLIRTLTLFYSSSYSVELCSGAFKHEVEKVLIPGTFLYLDAFRLL